MGVSHTHAHWHSLFGNDRLVINLHTFGTLDVLSIAIPILDYMSKKSIALKMEEIGIATQIIKNKKNNLLLNTNLILYILRDY